MLTGLVTHSTLGTRDGASFFRTPRVPKSKLENVGKWEEAWKVMER